MLDEVFECNSNCNCSEKEMSVDSTIPPLEPLPVVMIDTPPSSPFIVVDSPLSSPTSPQVVPGSGGTERESLKAELRIANDMIKDILGNLDCAHEANRSLMTQIEISGQIQEALETNALVHQNNLNAYAVTLNTLTAQIEHYMGTAKCHHQECTQSGIILYSCGCKTCPSHLTLGPAYGENCYMCGYGVYFYINLNQHHQGNLLGSLESLDFRQNE